MTYQFYYFAPYHSGRGDRFPSSIYRKRIDHLLPGILFPLARQINCEWNISNSVANVTVSMPDQDALWCELEFAGFHNLLRLTFHTLVESKSVNSRVFTQILHAVAASETATR